MGYINVQEWNRYNTNINDLSEVTMKDFQFKINNKIRVTKNKNSRRQSMFYCIREPDTILHLIKSKNFGNLYIYD